jgi:hypothetical protein
VECKWRESWRQCSSYVEDSFAHNLRVEFKGWEIRFVERVHWVDTVRSTQTVQVGIDVDQKQSDGMALVAKEVMKGKEYMR